MIGYELSQLLHGIRETITEDGPEYRVWAALDDTCAMLGIDIPGIDDDLFDQEFADAAKSEYSEVISEFEVIARNFHKNGDQLELHKNLGKLSFFY